MKDAHNAENPGSWKGLESQLIPTIKMEGTEILVTVTGEVEKPNKLWVVLDNGTILGIQEMVQNKTTQRFSILTWCKNPKDLNGKKILAYSSFEKHGVWTGEPFTLHTADISSDLAALHIADSQSTEHVSVSSAWRIENGKKVITTTKTFDDGRTETSVTVEDASPAPGAAAPAAPAAPHGDSVSVSTSWRIENGRKTTTTVRTHADGRTETSVAVEDAAAAGPAPASSTQWRIEGGRKVSTTVTTHPDGRTETHTSVADPTPDELARWERSAAAAAP